MVINCQLIANGTVTRAINCRFIKFSSLLCHSLIAERAQKGNVTSAMSDAVGMTERALNGNVTRAMSNAVGMTERAQKGNITRAMSNAVGMM